jgi:hypothetical protein
LNALCTKRSNNNGEGFSGFLKVGFWVNFLKFSQRRAPFLSHAFTRGAPLLSAAFAALSALQSIGSERTAFSQPHRLIRNAAMKIASAASYASNPKRVTSTNTTLL